MNENEWYRDLCNNTFLLILYGLAYDTFLLLGDIMSTKRKKTILVDHDFWAEQSLANLITPPSIQPPHFAILLNLFDHKKGPNRTMKVRRSLWRPMNKFGARINGLGLNFELSSSGWDECTQISSVKIHPYLGKNKAACLALNPRNWS